LGIRTFRVGNDDVRKTDGVLSPVLTERQAMDSTVSFRIVFNNVKSSSRE